MKNKDTIRTHDKLYLNENRKHQPKEYFKFIVSNLKFGLNKKKVIDIGCATGDFLYYLSNCYPEAALYGADIDEELLNKMKIEVPTVKNMFQIDISNPSLDLGKYDAVFMFGVHSIFDDLNCLFTIKSMLNDKSSRAYIFGIWNPHDIDVIIKSRPSNTDGKYEKGWNIFSKKTVTNFLDNNGLKYKFTDFNINIDIKKNEKDPLRSWTINDINNSKIIINGLCVIHHFSLLEFSLNET